MFLPIFDPENCFIFGAHKREVNRGNETKGGETIDSGDSHYLDYYNRKIRNSVVYLVYFKEVNCIRIEQRMIKRILKP